MIALRRPFATQPEYNCTISAAISTARYIFPALTVPTPNILLIGRSLSHLCYDRKEGLIGYDDRFEIIKRGLSSFGIQFSVKREDSQDQHTPERVWDEDMSHLSADKPVIVYINDEDSQDFLHFPRIMAFTPGAHAIIITGWDSETRTVRFVDPFVSSSPTPTYCGTVSYGRLTKSRKERNFLRCYLQGDYRPNAVCLKSLLSNEAKRFLSADTVGMYDYGAKMLVSYKESLEKVYNGASRDAIKEFVNKSYFSMQFNGVLIQYHALRDILRQLDEMAVNLDIISLIDDIIGKVNALLRHFLRWNVTLSEHSYQIAHNELEGIIKEQAHIMQILSNPARVRERNIYDQFN